MPEKTLSYTDVFHSTISFASRIYEIIDRVVSYNPDADVERIKRAYVFAAQAHGLQKRKSGELFITHPLAVAGLLAEMRFDEDCIVTGLLHDTVEDTEVTLNDIAENFGPDIAQLVDGVTKLDNVGKKLSKQVVATESMRKMLFAMTRNLRVIFVKLADRLHNMSTLGFMPPASAQRIARETLQFYAPLANRLGMQWMKQALQELSFFTLEKERYCELAAMRDEYIASLRHTPAEMEALISNALQANGFKAEVTSRTKHIYSLHNKLKEKQVPFSALNDVLAFRIITEENSKAACYQALGLIHELYRYHIGSFKDYISSPKSNGYQSLHTAVYLESGQCTEIQIRTRKMHEYAEEGVAAHWRYKENPDAEIENLEWVKILADYSREASDSAEFLENVQLDLFIQEVFVFSRDGDVYALPRGATALDFAYAIHTTVGNQCVAVRVNGEDADLSRRLYNGDRVEVITNPEQSPSHSWLGIVRTSRARHAIRQFFRKQSRAESIALGERLLRNFGSNEIPPSILRQLGCDSMDELKEQLGRNELSFDQLFRSLYGKVDGGKLDGISQHMFYPASCCYPVPGDAVVGRFVKSRGIELHGIRCRRVTQTPAEWQPFNWIAEERRSYTTGIKLKTSNQRGMLSRISTTITGEGINIEDMRMDQLPGSITHLYFLIEVNNRKQLADVMRKLNRLDGVIRVRREQHDHDSDVPSLKPLPEAVAGLRASAQT